MAQNGSFWAIFGPYFDPFLAISGGLSVPFGPPPEIGVKTPKSGVPGQGGAKMALFGHFGLLGHINY